MEEKKKKTVGYTTGIFDMFHVGHLNILRRAKEQCDYLIVGVSTDELCLSYKHKKPVIPFEERKRIIQAIRYVDEVVAQEDRDKFRAWETLKFDKMFVGDDWKGSPLFAALEEKFRRAGVEIVYFPYTQGTSSTMLREKLDKLENETV
ncbi:adenylyltransferase/cytidyltransferase family protein [Bacteroides sp. AN502(2024)]|uniref:adenylyltransferase/cytidyltransferase family protein n=1 Tax=Bacteroides sp. AN502(2024) TaxID=3160599 RepID=UPI003511D813